jgi:hypothetical protein
MIHIRKLLVVLMIIFFGASFGCGEDAKTDGDNKYTGNDIDSNSDMDSGSDNGNNSDAESDTGSDTDSSVYGDTDSERQIHGTGCNSITHEFQKGMTGSLGSPTWYAALGAAGVGESTTAYWKYGKQTTLTVTFDDSTQGQAKYAIPKLKELGIVGTFFVNPGTEKFVTENAIWHTAYTVSGQEIANHTWQHEGGATAAQAEEAVDLAGDYIRKFIYGIDSAEEKILAFNRAGGTDWYIDPTSEDWNMFIRGNYLFERKYSSGVSPGTTYSEMRDLVLAAFQSGGTFETTGGSIHFHGICDDEIYLNCDNESVEFPTNNGAVQKSHFYDFLEWLVDPTGFPATNIWLAGYAEYRKYMVARSGTTVHLDGIDGSGSDIVIHIELNFSMPSVSEIEPVQYTSTYGLTWGNDDEMANPDLYRCEPITVYTKIPEGWPAARVTLETGESHVYRVDNAEVRYEAFPNSTVTIESAQEENIDIPYVGIPL